MEVTDSSAILRWAAAGLYHTGLIRPLTRVIGYAGRGPAFQVLTYHRVNDEQDPFFPSVPTKVFEGQMAYIARSYRVLTVEELARRLHWESIPGNSLAITFDDGYRDNLTLAAPILARYGLPATVFLTTGWISTGDVPWFDRLALAFKRTSLATLRAPWGETVGLTTEDSRLQALRRALGYLKGLPEADFRQTLDGLLETLAVGSGNAFRDLMLTWEEVHALAGLGFSIGAHTVNHPVLSRVPAQRAWKEILGSRTMIEAACGRPPKVFAYPNGRPGDYTETVKQLVRQAGFSCAVTTRFGLNTRDTCPFELRRGGPWEEHLPTYALKLAWYRQAGI